MSCTCTFVMRTGPHPLEPLQLDFGKEGQARRSQIWQVWRIGCDDCVGVAKKLLHFQCIMTRSQFSYLHQMFSLRCVTVKLSVDSLTLGDEFKFNTTL